ncbi:MAG: ribosome small subunit-dependent GTPase A [Anaerolineae bacterium]|nr:ribosome small subunit-dependent GTPase A [Anaerolineae bacterium]
MRDEMESSWESLVEAPVLDDEVGDLITGLVIRKDLGHYQVQVGDRAVSCEISNLLRKRLLYPLRNPASLEHYGVQRVADIQVVDPVAVGDWVAFVERDHGTGLIKDVLPRKSQVSRLAPGPVPLEQVLVANVDQMVIVMAAARPKPKWHLLDRYLVTAEAAEVPAIVCITKVDLVEAGDLAPTVDLYRDLGYPVLLTSAVDGTGIETAQAVFEGRLSVLLGKSGVGKSSLLNALEPGLGLRVRAVGSGKIGKGRHTTTHLELVPLSNGGGVVDTPGMRELALWEARPADLPWFFPEFRPYLGTCRFGASCVHDHEPGCTVKDAVDDGTISPARYESYLKLMAEMS